MKTTLSVRQTHVLDLLVEGKSKKEVAAELGVSYTTISEHLEHMRRKTDSRTNYEMMFKLGRNSVSAPKAGRL